MGPGRGFGARNRLFSALFGVFSGSCFGGFPPGFGPLYPVLGGLRALFSAWFWGPKGPLWGPRRVWGPSGPKPVQQPLARFRSVRRGLACFRVFSGPSGPETLGTLLVLPCFRPGFGALSGPVFRCFWPFPFSSCLGPPGYYCFLRLLRTKIVLLWFWLVRLGWLARCFLLRASRFPVSCPFGALYGPALRAGPYMALTGPWPGRVWPVFPVFPVFRAFGSWPGPLGLALACLPGALRAPGPEGPF